MSTIVGSYVCSVLRAKPVRWRWRRLTGTLFDPYRPELHYMRGPGPKWRQKHAQAGRTTP